MFLICHTEIITISLLILAFDMCIQNICISNADLTVHRIRYLKGQKYSQEKMLCKAFVRGVK